MFTEAAGKYKSEELTSSPIWKYKSPPKVKVVWEEGPWDLVKSKKTFFANDKKFQENCSEN